ncbi:hypothetical protein ACRAWF_32775 [Streptomyces sp. L7]
MERLLPTDPSLIGGHRLAGRLGRGRHGRRLPGAFAVRRLVRA